MVSGGTINGGNFKSDRSPFDFYPTPPDVTQVLVEFLDLRDKVIWEPACGDGAMSKVLEKTNTVISSDLRTDTYGETGVDFLHTRRECDWIVTNPPFGLAEEFIAHALSITKNCAFLLKSQFWHAKKRHRLFTDLPPAYVLPLTWRPDFLGIGASLMDCHWTVWMADHIGPCRYIPLGRTTQQQELTYV